MTKNLDELKRIWALAMTNQGTRYSVGRIVVCDMCGVDWTDSTASGGFAFSDYMYCPTCAVNGLENIKKHGEEHYIHAVCPPDEAFADWVRRLNPDRGILVRRYEPGS